MVKRIPESADINIKFVSEKPDTLRVIMVAIGFSLLVYFIVIGIIASTTDSPGLAFAVYVIFLFYLVGTCGVFILLFYFYNHVQYLKRDNEIQYAMLKELIQIKIGISLIHERLNSNDKE